MNLSNCKLTIDGEEVQIHEVKVDYHFEGEYPEIFVKAYPRPSDFMYGPNERESMSVLNEVPNNLDKFVNENFRAFYKLGWVDEELTLTDKGKREFVNFLFLQTEEEFGKLAQEKVAEITKEEKGK